MRIKELCEDELPREKMMAKGCGVLTNAELLAVLMRAGTRKRNAIDLGRDILQEFNGSLTDISRLSVRELSRIDGVGAGKACTILAAIELGRRYINETPRKKVQIKGPESVFRMMRPVFKGLSHEECWIVLLSRDNSVLSREMLSSGGLDSTTFDTRLIMKKILDKKATAVIMLHNHPSGTPLPGSKDIQATQKLRKALETFDIQLLDHIIISDGSYYSFAEEMVFEAP